METIAICFPCLLAMAALMATFVYFISEVISHYRKRKHSKIRLGIEFTKPGTLGKDQADLWLQVVKTIDGKVLIEEAENWNTERTLHWYTTEGIPTYLLEKKDEYSFFKINYYNNSILPEFTTYRFEWTDYVDCEYEVTEINLKPKHRFS